jgi:hypothetical protein
MTTDTKNRIGKYGFLIFFFLLGGVAAWAYWPRKAVHQDEFGRRRQTSSTQPGPTDAQRQAWEAEREQREKEMDDRVNAFLHAKTLADRNAILDQQIDEFLEMRKEWEQRHADEGPATQPTTQPRNGGMNGANGQARAKARMANRVVNGDAQKGAMRSAYFQAVQQRAAQRGIQMGGGPGGGGGGGFRGR